MPNEVNQEESRTILSTAADVRPDENVHDDPDLATPAVAKGEPVSRAESEQIMRLAADVRPLENVHRESDG